MASSAAGRLSTLRPPTAPKTCNRTTDFPGAPGSAWESTRRPPSPLKPLTSTLTPSGTITCVPPISPNALMVIPSGGISASRKSSSLPPRRLTNVIVLGGRQRPLNLRPPRIDTSIVRLTELLSAVCPESPGACDCSMRPFDYGTASVPAPPFRKRSGRSGGVQLGGWSRLRRGGGGQD
jgi:hypothetical protein